MTNVFNIKELHQLTEGDREAYTDPTFSSEIFEKTLEKPSTFAFVARTAEGTWQGHVLCRHTTDEGELLTIWVAEDCRQQGIGTQLMEAALGRFKLSGVHSVHLEVRSANLPARHMYESFGGILVGNRADYYPPTDTQPRDDAALYQIQL